MSSLVILLLALLVLSLKSVSLVEASCVADVYSKVVVRFCVFSFNGVEEEFVFVLS